MGRHPVNQRLDRVNTNGSLDLQSGGLAVSATLLYIATQKLMSPV